ncbi:hypothetical protein ACODT3_42785 [Streptomyces sp. 4.24]|uniref:hypothetical protein n=1 Tax=Streptomyces tritrimontium TaxID=3406573 RepID=UPI003BB50237
MARMLARTTPRYAGRTCRFAGRGCTCYFLSPTAQTNSRSRGRVRTLERRRARAAEGRAWRLSAHGG